MFFLNKCAIISTPATCFQTPIHSNNDVVIAHPEYYDHNIYIYIIINVRELGNALMKQLQSVLTFKTNQQICMFYILMMTNIYIRYIKLY